MKSTAIVDMLLLTGWRFGERWVVTVTGTLLFFLGFFPFLEINVAEWHRSEFLGFRIPAAVNSVCRDATVPFPAAAVKDQMPSHPC